MDQHSWIVVLGGNPLNGGFSEFARSHDKKLAIVDWNETVSVQCDAHFRIDIKDASATLEAVKSLPGRLWLAYTSSDLATETVARLNAYAGLGRSSTHSLDVARNKAAMNRAWETAGLLNKKYYVCTSAQELASFALFLDQKLIVKPSDAASSRGITIVEKSELDSFNWSKTFARAQAESPSGEVVVETFVEGTEFTVEMLGDRHGNVQVCAISKKYHTSNVYRNKIAVKLHYNAPDVTQHRQEQIASFAADCFRAVGLTSSMGHLELIEQPDGMLVPLEIGARSSGYIATHLASLLMGGVGNYVDSYREVLLGASVTNGLIHSEHSTMYFFYDPPLGVWREAQLSLIDLLPAGVESLAFDRRRLVSGARFEHIDSDSERVGFEILAGPIEDMRIETIQLAEQQLYAACVSKM